MLRSRCEVLKGLAERQLERARQIARLPSRLPTSEPSGMVLVCLLEDGAIWWRGGDGFPDRLLGSLQAVSQLLAADARAPPNRRAEKHKLQDTCFYLSLDDAPLDGLPEGHVRLPVLTSHRSAGVPPSPLSFL